MMKHITQAILFLLIPLSVNSSAQSDWHTYPVRSIADIIQAHSGESSRKADLIVSADPFPSKTVATYTGKRRPVGAYAKYFIDLWAQSRNLAPENSRLLVEEYLFRENDKEYWMPVIRLLTPHFDRELKEGDEITIYYFFLGGYNEKRLREKKKDKPEAEPNLKLEDKVEWVFAVEEFQKPAPKVQAGSGASISQPLASAIDRNLGSSGQSVEFLIDPRQVKSKSRVFYTGEVRNVSEKKLRFLERWLQTIGLPQNTVEILRQEVLFREGDQDYWLPIRKKILEEMKGQLKKGDEVVIHSLLVGGVPQGAAIEWVFVVGEFSR